MAKRHHILKSGLLKWAKIISRTLGINIVFSGHQPQTDGKTIVAFALPDVIDVKLEKALIGAIDHECGHVDPVDGSMIQSDKFVELDAKLRKEYGNLGPMTWNVLEDMRIETVLQSKFPGCYPYLEAVRRWLWDNSDQFKEERDKQMPNSAKSALVALTYVRFPRLFKEIIVPRVSTEILMLVRYWTHFVVRSCNADDVWETYDLTVELLKDLKQMADGGGGGDGEGIDSGLPGDSSGKGKGKGKGKKSGGPSRSGDSSGSDSGSGEGSGSVDSKNDSSTLGGGDSSEGASRKGSGSGPEGGVGSPETSDKPVDGRAKFDWNDVYEEHPDFVDTAPESTPVSNTEILNKLKDVSKRVVSDKSDFHVPDFGAKAIGDIEKNVNKKESSGGRRYSGQAGYRIDDNDVHVETASEASELSRQVEEESSNLYPVLRQKLRSLLLAKRANRHRSEQEEGDIDPGQLYALAIPNGPRNVFSQVSRGKSVSTSALLLIDGSSSMNDKGRSQVVMRCARFFSGSLEKCSVPTEVSVFQNGSRGAEVDYQVVKLFDERVQTASSRFKPMASGGTPMAEAMVESVRRLSVRKEKRKILFVLTDGAPNNKYGDARAFMVRLADAANEIYGIETIGLGVGDVSCLQDCFRDFVMLDKGSRGEVERHFIDVLYRRLLKS